jgi:hypothetical protein
MLTPSPVVHRLKVVGLFAEDQQWHIADVAFAECPLAVRQVVVPHAQEAVVESRLAYFGEVEQWASMLGSVYGLLES